MQEISSRVTTIGELSDLSLTFLGELSDAFSLECCYVRPALLIHPPYDSTRGPQMQHQSTTLSLFLGTALALALAALNVPPLWAAGTGNNTPVLAADTASHFGLGDLTVDVLANDIDPDGEALTITAVSPSGSCPESASGQYGLVVVTSVTNRPVACTFTYWVRDESGRSASATLTINAGTFEIFEDGFESGDTNAWSDACTTNCAE